MHQLLGWTKDCLPQTAINPLEPRSRACKLALQLTDRMACYAPDFGHYYRAKVHSDVIITLREVSSAGGCNGMPDEDGSAVLPGHAMVLVGNSSVWKAQLDNWPDSQCDNGIINASSSSKRCMEITVPAGQLEIGQHLLKAVYEKQPALSDLEPMQLLQLIQLADQYDVPKVVASAASSLASAPATDWPWEVVTAVLSQPESLRLQDHMKQLIDAATAQLREKLGDLEEVWGDEQLQKLLLDLPFAPLLQILQHADTRVASEHTVVYTILQWHSKQPAGLAAVQQPLQELMCCVRLQHCSVPYIHTYMIHHEVIRQCFSAEELSIAGMLVTMPTVFEGIKHPVLEKFPAWSAAKRPISTKQQVVEWQLPMTELRGAFESYLGQGMKEPVFHSSRPSVVQGQSFALGVKFAMHQVAGNEQTSFGFYPRLCDLPASAMRNVTFTLQADSIGFPHKALKSERPLTKSIMAPGTKWGYPVFTRLGKVSSWTHCEEAFIQKGLVHADNCLHLRADISQLQ